MEPAVGVDGLSSLLGIVQVSEHHVVPSDHDLAGLAPGQLVAVVVHDLHFDVGNGPSRGVGDGLGIVVVAAHGGDARRLGEAIAGDNGLEPQTGPHLKDHLHRDDGCPSHRQPQGGHVEAVEIGMVQDGLIDGRRSGQRGDALLGDPGHHRRDVEHRVGDVGGPGHEAGQNAGVEAESVEVGVDDQIAVADPQTDHLAPRLEAPADGGMDEHGPLGQSGSSRCEHDVAEIVAAHRSSPSVAVGLADLVGPVEELGQAGGSLGDGPPQHHDLIEVGAAVDSPQQGHIVGVQEVGDGEQDAGAGLLEDEVGFPALEPGVHRHQHASGQMDPQAGHHPLPDVGGPDRHPVAGFYARGHQRPGRGPDAISQLREGPAHVAVYQRLQVGKPLGSVVNQLADRSPRSIGHGCDPN